MEVGDIVDLKTDKRWRGGIIKQISHDRAYVEWPENEDNGYSAYSPHLVSNLIPADGQLMLF
ncbi:hypothetical protein [Paenibacillus sp. GYB003]|uniref:hypothetical protein n=1 Tax=Paenibacillus sp. GYB003 TaxID=2994392 RepID=UPI002F965B5E